MSTENEKPRGFFGRLFRGGGQTEQSPQKPSEQPSEPITELAPAPPVVADVEPETAPAAPESQAEAPRKGSWFQRLREGLTKTSAKLAEGITGVFTKRKLDAETLEDLEDLLIQADLGIETTERITQTLRRTRFDKTISPQEVREVLAREVEAVLQPVAQPLVIGTANKPHVIMFVGVNGTGKTTTIGKLAARYRTEGRRVMIAAGDTFRAAAVEQLKVWGERANAPVVSGAVGADAAGLAFDALSRARDEGADVLMIDTAGRLQNKAALMDELQKILRVIRKIDPSAPHHVVLVLDATTGQNALSQVEVFREKAEVSGLVMTKLDGTARGGILVAISAKFKLPVYAVGVGEGINDLQSFDASEFARAIAVE